MQKDRGASDLLARAEAAVRPSTTYVVKFGLDAVAIDNRPTALLAYRFFDDTGAVIEGPLDGFNHSKIFGPYHYVRDGGTVGQPTQMTFVTPPGATSVSVELCPWKAKSATLTEALTIDIAPKSTEDGGKSGKRRQRGEDEKPVECLARVSTDVKSGSVYVATFSLDAVAIDNRPPALLAYRFSDETGAVIEGRLDGYSYSKLLGAYHYVRDPGSADSTVEILFVAPPGAVEVSVELVSWKAERVALTQALAIAAARDAAGESREGRIPRKLVMITEPVEEFMQYRIGVKFDEELQKTREPAVASIKFRDAGGQVIDPGDGFSHSSLFGRYKYLEFDPDAADSTLATIFKAPAGAIEVQIFVYSWNQPDLPEPVAATIGPAYIRDDAIHAGRMELDGRRALRFTTRIGFDHPEQDNVALAGFQFFNEAGDAISGRVTGLDDRPTGGKYRYLTVPERAGSSGEFESTVECVVPEDAATLNWFVGPWGGAQISIPAAPEIRQHSAEILIGMDRLDPESIVQTVDPETGRRLREQVGVEWAWRAAAKEIANAAGAITAELHGDRWLTIGGRLQNAVAVGEDSLALFVSYFDEGGSAIGERGPGFVKAGDFGVCRFVTLEQAGDKATRRFEEPVCVPEDARFAVFLLAWLKGTGHPPVKELTIRPQCWEDIRDHLRPAQMGKRQLEALLAIADLVFDLPLIAEATSGLALFSPENASLVFRARIRRGQMRELDTGWLPDVPNIARYEPDPSSILHLFKVIYPDESSGGAVRSRNIVAEQANRGLSPTVAMPVNLHPLPETAPDGIVEIERDEVAVCYAKLLGLDRSRLPHDQLLSLETSLHARVAAHKRAGLVHAASGFRGYENALKGLVLARHFGLPMVYEVRSLHEETWRPLSATHLSDITTQMRTAQENRCMREADAVVTISQAMVDLLASRGIDREKLFFVPNAIGDEFTEPANPALTEKLRQELGFGDEPVIGYISNMAQREGHAVLVEAFAKLREASGQGQLLLVGDGAEMGNLERQARRLGVKDHVHLPGSVDHAMAKEWYCLLDILVVPRIEDFASDYVTPLKPFEAMALGVPVLMSDRPVAREITGAEQQRALQFTTADVDDLVGKLQKMLENPDQTRARAERARRWIFDKRCWASVVERYEAAYAYAREQRARRAEKGK